jgi:hypothetical protein
MLGVGFIVPFLVFAGFLLLLLVSLSIPIIHSISVLNIAANIRAGITSTGISGGLKFGLWGYCVSNITASYALLVCSLPRILTTCPPVSSV